MGAWVSALMSAIGFLGRGSPAGHNGLGGFGLVETDALRRRRTA